ncbi:MAG TPA: thiol:disulfide interchange protein DsbA/DsbL [Burkholderiales bacterium]|nr:thiol:disulfide interchange protein DsbA/DsbL [Burkholderiales bacterium]
MLKRLLAATALLFASTFAFAQESIHTELRQPLNTGSGNKIEVVEFFWYGCPHCYALEPYVQEWLTKLPSDVEFKRIPAPANDVWKVAARIFYSLDALGLQQKLHKAFFDAVQIDRLRPTNTQQVDDWLSRQGVDIARFHAAENSFAVESKLKRAGQLFDQSQSSGVPTIVVDGRYVVEMAKAQTPQNMMAAVDIAIEQARKNRAAKTAPQK